MLKLKRNNKYVNAFANTRWVSTEICRLPSKRALISKFIQRSVGGKHVFRNACAEFAVCTFVYFRGNVNVSMSERG